MNFNAGKPSFGRVMALAATPALLPCCTTNVGKGDELAEVTVLVSVLADGSHVTAPSTATPFTDGNVDASRSADGHFVVFESTSPQFAQGDTNGARDIIVNDRWTGEADNTTLLRISGVAMRFGPRGAECLNRCISGDGRYVLILPIGQASRSSLRDRLRLANCSPNSAS
jgi:hypothetical protein